MFRLFLYSIQPQERKTYSIVQEKTEKHNIIIC